MATTSDLAPGRKPAAARASRANSRAREAQLEDQIGQLQDDLKAIAATLSRLSNDKVNEVKAVAKSEASHLQRQAEHVVEDVQDQASALEKQLKDTIREKPLTAVASAVGIGFILALLSRH
ncbi:DUF883 family protein [Devosia sp. Root635]|uniref:DUF883 family protein n=1 Tax=Devosia sp. Root635 TaxID=1736575 RepID=UPI0006FBD93A|nr:DUF883 family protein [Devosia sp. Root635]KRA50490.1 hypothetical protein ASD80_15905 [Devosia sp. Root635]